MKRIGTAALAASLLFAGQIGLDAAHATAQQARTVPATNLGARRHDRHYRYHRDAHQPYYYDRPRYYAPGPFLPIPPLFGYGWEWW